MSKNEFEKTEINISFSGFPENVSKDIVERLKGGHIRLSEDAKITFLQAGPFDEGRQMSLWHGGDVVEIELPNKKLVISAAGDVYASLIDKADGTELFYVKGKCNRGEFGGELSSYIKNDDELNILLDDEHPKYAIEMTNNNWWECFGLTNDGRFIDLMWALDADKISDAIVEVLDGYHDFIDDL